MFLITRVLTPPATDEDEDGVDARRVIVVEVVSHRGAGGRVLVVVLVEEEGSALGVVDAQQRRVAPRVLPTPGAHQQGRNATASPKHHYHHPPLTPKSMVKKVPPRTQ